MPMKLIMIIFSYLLYLLLFKETKINFSVSTLLNEARMVFKVDEFVMFNDEHAVFFEQVVFKNKAYQ